jgi:hypothetical protein
VPVPALQYPNVNVWQPEIVGAQGCGMAGGQQATIKMLLMKAAVNRQVFGRSSHCSGLAFIRTAIIRTAAF